MKQERTFARIVGRKPCLEDSDALIHADLDEIVNTFGPAEIQMLGSSRLLFWSFQKRDEVGRFSLWVEPPTARKSVRNLDIEVSTNRNRDWESFFDWVLDRLGAVSNCEERPVVLNGAGFVVVPA